MNNPLHWFQGPLEEHLKESYSIRLDAAGTAAILLLILAVLLAVLGAVFLGLCVYNDALSRQNPNAGMWGVLCGFFGAIVALIYLIIVTTSKNQPPRCVRCGSFLPPPVPGGPAGPVCPVCGLPAAVLPAEQMRLYAGRRRRYLILWIVMLAAAFILIAGSTGLLVFLLLQSCAG